jgi:hypothetical protein
VRGMLHIHEWLNELNDNDGKMSGNAIPVSQQPYKYMHVNRHLMCFVWDTQVLINIQMLEEDKTKWGTDIPLAAECIMKKCLAICSPRWLGVNGVNHIAAYTCGWGVGRRCCTHMRMLYSYVDGWSQ